MTGQPTMAISSVAYDLQNDGGSWSCGTNPSFTHNVDASFTVVTDETSSCTGSGAYEGLSAILAIDWSQHGLQTVPFTGVIFPGELPASP